MFTRHDRMKGRVEPLESHCECWSWVVDEQEGSSAFDKSSRRRVGNRHLIATMGSDSCGSSRWWTNATPWPTPILHLNNNHNVNMCGMFGRHRTNHGATV